MCYDGLDIETNTKITLETIIRSTLLHTREMFTSIDTDKQSFTW